jgi:murine toxin
MPKTKIDAVQSSVDDYFNHLSGPSYVRILDTPHVWGMAFSDEIMPAARERQAEFERAIVEIVQKTRYRCDVSSLNTPDPDWARVILGAMDAALSENMGRRRRTQFRFLFGQTPLYPTSPPPNYTDFQGALIRLVRTRSSHWEMMPEIWMGRFYRLGAGISSSLLSRIISSSIISTGDTKMTWNHSKIIAVDGAEALVGGHNLNMDLFTSYPPVHDASVVMHGEAAHGSQLYLNQMWECKTDLLTKEYLDVDKLVWKNGDDDKAAVRKPADPLSEGVAALYVKDRQASLVLMHGDGGRGGARNDAPNVMRGMVPQPLGVVSDAQAIQNEDLQTLIDVEVPVFEERKTYNEYDKLQDYKLATRVLSVGKYWTGSNMNTDYQKGSEIMKEHLIKNAKTILRFSQMDLVSAWKKNWSSHSVCQWIMEALLKNKKLVVQVVVSPLDAGAGAEGDQYSFGSGACRTFELMKYYMTHAVDTDAELADGDGARAHALERLHIAPLYFTDRVPEERTIEGETYQWPNLSKKGYTATLKQAPLDAKPPKNGIIGSAAAAVLGASGAVYDKVPSAPGNHAKIMVVDDELYVVGSDNLYPGYLSEFNYLIEGKAAVSDLLKSYWSPLWLYSGRHCVNPVCKAGREEDRNQNVPIAPHL